MKNSIYNGEWMGCGDANKLAVSISILEMFIINLLFVNFLLIIFICEMNI